MCDFCALSPVQRKNMLAKFFNFLEPGGSVLLDVYSLSAFKQRKETALYEANLLDGFWSPNKYYGFLNTFKYERNKMVLDKYTIVEADHVRPFTTGFNISNRRTLRRNLRNWDLLSRSSMQMLPEHHTIRKQTNSQLLLKGYR
jgi:hypothetical protein